MLDEDLDPAAAQISILTSVVGNLSTRPLRRILEIHNVSFSPDNNVGQLRKHLKAYLKRLRQGKKLDGLKTNWMDQNNLAKTQRSRERATLCNEWPQLVPKSLKERLIQGFGLRISTIELGRGFSVRPAWAAVLAFCRLLPADELRVYREKLRTATTLTKNEWIPVPAQYGYLKANASKRNRSAPRGHQNKLAKAGAASKAAEKKKTATPAGRPVRTRRSRRARKRRWWTAKMTMPTTLRCPTRAARTVYDRLKFMLFGPPRDHDDPDAQTSKISKPRSGARGVGQEGGAVMYKMPVNYGSIIFCSFSHSWVVVLFQYNFKLVSEARNLNSIVVIEPWYDSGYWAL
ncbi:hypothetical protein B0H14DRAFT_2559164 [Mycena olivaceomarginata]|nr:hypothetical protein B0H14DRAFT_2559164 [Mycena olivaceomarginata]